MLTGLYVTLGFFTLLFIFATIIKNNSIVDIGWGLGFVLSNWIVFFIFKNYSVVSIIANTMVSLWGIRLFYHILKRNVFQEEDFRYANWRKAWGKWVIPRAFLQVFMLQGLLQFLIASVPLYLNGNIFSFNWFSLIGVLIWVYGYYYQVKGDLELKQFIALPKPKPQLLTTGLWSKTRHPNYFGESMMWIGIYLFGLINGVPWYFIISPITISVVLIFISTPLLEERMSKRDGWEEYAEKTPVFFPNLVKRGK